MENIDLGRAMTEILNSRISAVVEAATKRDRLDSIISVLELGDYVRECGSALEFGIDVQTENPMTTSEVSKESWEDLDEYLATDVSWFKDGDVENKKTLFQLQISVIVCTMKLGADYKELHLLHYGMQGIDHASKREKISKYLAQAQYK